MIDLRHHVALVTGSSRGIGRACALRLAQAGADVIINYVAQRAAALDVAGSIAALGRRTAVIRADVSESEDIAALGRHVTEQFGRLDIVISNAATGGFRPLLANTARQFHAAMSTNVEALLHLLRELSPLLEAKASLPGSRQRRRAKVLAISSHGSRYALPNYGLVGMTKAALESLVRQAALELGPSHINVNALISGPVATDALKDIPSRERVFAHFHARSLCSGRTLDVDDVADVALFLASPLADMIQGQTLVVDSGLSVGLGTPAGETSKEFSTVPE